MPDPNGQTDAISPQLAELLEQHHRATRAAPEQPVLEAVPRPPAAPDTEVELSLGVDEKGQTLVLGFGTVVAWIALTATEARALAGALVQYAERIDPTPPTEDNE